MLNEKGMHLHLSAKTSFWYSIFTMTEFYAMDTCFEVIKLKLNHTYFLYSLLCKKLHDNIYCVLFTEVSTKLVSEYKTKLQISEAENSRLDGMVRRGEG